MDYTKLGITPINEQNPAGKDVKYDEDFELIESEMSKLTSPSASGLIDWNKIIKLSCTILQTKSKNLLIAVYLSYALYKQQGLDGLSDGVKVLADILEYYWETLYPPKKRLKGRINAVEWWLEKISKDLENLDDTLIQSDEKDNLIKNLHRIDDFLNEHLDNAPLFYNLIKLLDMKLLSDSQDKIQKEVIAKESVKSPSLSNETPKQVDKEPQKLSSNVEDDFKATINSLNILIGQMIEEKDYRSELFIINRAFAWLDIDEVPSSEKNMTMLPPPEAQEIELLNSLYDEKKYETLLWAAESRITTYLFWLDLHYFVAQSLKHLQHIEASQAVYEQTLYFIKKLPNLKNLTFSDSTPFATKRTKEWLKPKELKKEEVLITEEQKEEVDINSIDALNQKMNSCISVEEEVFYNIKICRFLLQNRNETLIYTYLHKLLDTIEQYGTSKWSPKIALEAYGVGIECLKVLDNETDSELLNLLLKKIALLKPSLIV